MAIVIVGGVALTLQELQSLADALEVNPGAIVRGQVVERRPRVGRYELDDPARARAQTVEVANP